MNNFQQLEEEQIRGVGAVPPEIKRKIDSNVSMMHYVGDILDLFLPRVFEFIAVMAGGSGANNKSEETKKYPNR